MRLIGAVIAVALSCIAGPAFAHTRSVSYSTWEVRGGGATARVRVSRLDAEALRAAWGEAGLSARLPGAVRLRVGGADCSPVDGSFRELRADPQWRRFEWDVRCSPDGALAVRSDLLFDLVPAHVHFARVGDAELALGEETREADVPAAGGTLASAGRFVRLGVEHIFGGFDHLVFLLALILAARRLSDVGVAVTGFTVGHSVTLALATLGYVCPDTASVEALIGLSIAVVAVESVWLSRERRGAGLPAGAVIAIAVAALTAPLVGGVSALALAGAALFVGCYFGLLARAERPERLRCAVAGLFGLVHGFGFAGVLQQIDLPADRVVGPLLGFNAGVELGQLAVLALAWPVVVALRRLGPRADRLALAGGSALAVALGVFWFVTRAYG